MSSKRIDLKPQAPKPGGRPVGGTEHSWCRAMLGGTGIAVLAILSSKKPQVESLENALRKLQHSHPILRSRLRSSNAIATTTFSFVTSPTPFVHVKSLDASSTSKILKPQRENKFQIPPLQLVLEHELNENSWLASARKSSDTTDLFFSTAYALPDNKLVLVLRLHVAACDHTTAASLLRELLVLMGDDLDEGGAKVKRWNKEEISSAIEDLIPKGKGEKPFWARGMDMLGYSLNSLRLTNLRFNDTKSPMHSQVVRFHINQDDTKRILAGCKARGIKLSGALAAAGLMAAHESKCDSDHQTKKKYGVVTLTDCRSSLEPPLSANHFGFYHSAILNTQNMRGGENLWELAKKLYTSFQTSKNCNRHFLDMADVNFLMCKAADNPGLTPSSSLRTSFLSVFEDSVIDDSVKMQEDLGVEDYLGCASVHGIGPSVGVFDTIRDGKLDVVCVYPAPLHSREQMIELVEKMKMILVDGCNNK